MKLMIASDIHGSAYYCKKMLEAFAWEQADRLLLLGDILYHGPRNDLPKEYAPKEVIALLNGMKQQIFCVRGNCDTEVDQMVLEFPIMADYCVLPIASKTPAAGGCRLLYATHGHRYSRENLPPLQDGDILLCVHTQIPAWESLEGDKLYLNPGSVSIPKAGSEHGYMVLEETKAVWKNLDGREYHSLEL